MEEEVYYQNRSDIYANEKAKEPDGRHYLCDMPDDVLDANPSYAGKIGFICEFDE